MTTSRAGATMSVRFRWRSFPRGRHWLSTQYPSTRPDSGWRSPRGACASGQAGGVVRSPLTRVWYSSACPWRVLRSPLDGLAILVHAAGRHRPVRLFERVILSNLGRLAMTQNRPLALWMTGRSQGWAPVLVACPADDSLAAVNWFNPSDCAPIMKQRSYSRNVEQVRESLRAEIECNRQHIANEDEPVMYRAGKASGLAFALSLLNGVDDKERAPEED